MSGIRAKNTKPEIQIRRALHGAGFRFRLHDKGVPGKPDLVLPKHEAVIFVHGCFWHGHDCPLFRLPGTRQRFWKAKIERNRQRDSQVQEELMESGWRSATVWECALRGPARLGIEETTLQLKRWLLKPSQRYCEIRAPKGIHK